MNRSEGVPRTRITKSSCACDCGRGPVSVGAFFFLSFFSHPESYLKNVFQEKSMFFGKRGPGEREEAGVRGVKLKKKRKRKNNWL